MVGRLLLAAAVAGGVFYGYPLWNERASSACQAMEQRFLTMATESNPIRPSRVMELAVMRRLEPLSGGAMAAAQAKQHYPQLPAELGCAAGYWASIINPHVQETLASGLER